MTHFVIDPTFRGRALLTGGWRRRVRPDGTVARTTGSRWTAPTQRVTSSEAMASPRAISPRCGPPLRCTRPRHSADASCHRPCCGRRRDGRDGHRLSRVHGHRAQGRGPRSPASGRLQGGDHPGPSTMGCGTVPRPPLARSMRTCSPTRTLRSSQRISPAWSAPPPGPPNTVPFLLGDIEQRRQPPSRA
jgi:hypothetical protein